ncbi:MAG: GerMN domain-containing protein [Candidatus Cloacimonetes bacterium]|nr:GerMN domain-containing protein [Candidatus Cloacimonadota bacterium]
MVSQEIVWSANIRLSELIKGPKTSEGDEAWPCFPSGITSDDVLDTNVYKSTLEVNLSKNFKDRCMNLSSDEEMLLIFAIVNTLTDMQGINSVQFLIEGKKSEELAGNLYFKDIFIKNPGFVQVDF